MTKIVAAVAIERPIGKVFDYATTPANWPSWHPASRAVRGATDHSLAIGEEVAEAFVAAGKAGSCVWRVTERETPRLWRITTSTPQGNAEITYRLEERGDTTVFERELGYEISGFWLGVVDLLVIRHRMTRESRLALQRLKQRLELPSLSERMQTWDWPRNNRIESIHQRCHGRT